MDCLSFCFGKHREREDPEREPLIPKGRRHYPSHETNGSVQGNGSAPPSSSSSLDKVINVITAIKAGKLPSQSQIEDGFKALLASEFLQDEGGPTMGGNGPFSKQGRRVLADVRKMVQALLEFGLEKNADDKIQDTYFQLLHLSSEPRKDIVIDNSDCKVGLQENTPLDEQIAFDAQTFIFAVRTLLGTILSSSAFRVLMLDFLAIINELMETAAKDVKRAANQVQKVAEDLENKAKSGHDVIDDTLSKGETSTKDVKEKGKAIVDTAQTATKDLKNELGAQAHDAADDAKERLLSRIRQLLSRHQKDPSSCAAMRSVTTLFQKYSAILSTFADESKSSTKGMSSEVADTLEDTTRSTYPPDPYGQRSRRKTPAFTPSETLLANLKELLERLGRGHSLDPLLAALRRVLVDLHDDVPKAIRSELKEAIEQHVEEANPEKFGNTPTLTPIQTQPPFSEQVKGKGKSRKAARKARKRSQKLERCEPVTPISPSDSQNGVTPAESRNFPTSTTDSSREPNVVNLYFVRVGEYFNKASEEPDWATSREGSRALETLFDDGVFLINVVGESIVDVGDQVVTTAPSSDDEQSRGTSEADDDDEGRQTTDNENDRIRRQFKADLQTLAREADEFISALRSDKTTMKVWNAWQTLGEDGQKLVAIGGRRAYGYMHSLSPWTEWVGWAVPRLLKMLPLSAIPIPTVEFKTPYLEGALHALFVQGLARGKDNVAQGSLIPDEVIVKEFTEFKLNMVDRPLHSSMPMLQVPPGTLHKPNLDATARLQLHANGIRAKIERVGYYFKYTGTLCGYEDQGILTVDLAIESPHEGFGIDIELEMDGSRIVQAPSSPVPEIIVEGESRDGTERSTPVTLEADALMQGPPKPLYNVLDVHVMMRGLRVSIDQSKHWILNKVFFQPVAGPAIATGLQGVLEQQVHAKLQSLSLSLGEIVQEATRRSEIRRLRRHGRENESQDRFLNVLGDFWGAVVEVGPHAFGHDDNQKDQQTRTESTVDTTSRGLVYTSKQLVTEQPTGTTSMTAGPTVEAEETVVAVGLGGQLFPDKVDATASYGATDDSVRDPLGRRIDKGVSEAQNAVGHVGDQWVQSSQRENDTKMKTWRSNAFDLD